MVKKKKVKITNLKILPKFTNTQKILIIVIPYANVSDSPAKMLPRTLPWTSGFCFILEIRDY